MGTEIVKSETQEKFMALLNRKLKAAQTILEYTQNLHIPDDMLFDDKAEAISELFEKREPLFTGIAELDKELANPAYAQFGQGAQDLAQDLNEEIRKTAGAIMELDKKLAEIAAKCSEELRSNIKTLKMGANIRNIYADDRDEQSGHYFDKRN